MWLSAFPLAGQAHDLWAYAQQAEAGKDLLAVLGYGDRFPEGEKKSQRAFKYFKSIGVAQCGRQKHHPHPKGEEFSLCNHQPRWRKRNTTKFRAAINRHFGRKMTTAGSVKSPQMKDAN